MKKTKVFQMRLSESEEETINLASKMSDIDKAKIVREGALKEAKRILRQIEKGE